MTCDLCGEESQSYRCCQFGERSREICTTCMDQWKTGTEGFPVLTDRYLKVKCPVCGETPETMVQAIDHYKCFKNIEM